MFMTKEKYQSYLTSKHWISVRRRYWKSKLYKTCYICGCSGNLQLHHRTYERLGHERLTDLVPVHDLCHLSIHKYYNENKCKGVTLWQAGTAVKCSYRKGKV